MQAPMSGTELFGFDKHFWLIYNCIKFDVIVDEGFADNSYAAEDIRK